jgi:cysteine desulfuration protein SufE
MATIPEIQNQLVEDFSFMEDWEDKYAFLIDLGKELPAFPANLKTEDNLIRGCQSRVWITAGMENGRVQFAADSDAFISKGMVALLVKVYHNQKPEDILHEKLDLLERIGLHEHLSPNRSNGLASMLKQLRNFALVFHSQNQLAG